MALALRSAAPLRSDVALAQAISEFELLLTPEQKTSFNDLRTRAIRSAPSADDVMKQTADINQRLVTRKQASSSMYRCFGTRFSNVLQCLQRYAALGEVVAGGSQNIIACGVWALMRVTIQVCLGFGTYLDKISHFFMTAGQTAPRYESMAYLYRRSGRLDQYMSQYLLVIVQSCHHFVQFSRKSFFGQLASSLDDSKMRDAQTDLARWASCIREEVAFLTSETVEDEASKSKSFRAMVGKTYEWEAQQRFLRQKAAFLEALSTTDHETPYKQARKRGTSTIFHSNDTFDSWKESRLPACLLLLGKLGSGKSVAMASIVDDLYLFKPDCTVTYFFCRHDNAEGLTSRAVIGSLCRQLVSKFFNESLLANTVDGLQAHFNIAEVMEVLYSVMPSEEKVFFILDGIDECPEHEAQEIIKAIHTLQQRLNLSICISYRSGAQDPSIIFGSYMQTLVMPEDNLDISKFIDEELRRRLESNQLVLGNEAIILEIREALLRGANGMFLWVALQLDCLCEERTDQSIRAALQVLPPDLFTTFARILQRCRDASAASSSYQIQILQLVVAAYRPLSVHEIREILSIEPGVAEWDPERLVNDIDSVLACCGSLVIIDEENLSIRMIHQSVMQFLLSEAEEEWHFTEEQAQRHMGECTMTYLNYSVFETRLTTKVAKSIPVGQLPSQIMQKRGKLGQLALKLLASTSKSDFDAKGAMNEAVRRHRQDIPKELFHFLDYASKFWLWHTKWVSEESSMLDLWVRLYENPRFSSLMWMEGTAPRPVDSSTGTTWILSPRVVWAIANGHIPLYRYEIRGKDWARAISTVVPYLRMCLVSRPRPELRVNICTTLLPLVAMVDSGDVVDWLISLGANMPVAPSALSPRNFSISDGDYKIIRSAISLGKLEHVRVLRLMFRAALQRRDFATARLLLDKGGSCSLYEAFSCDINHPAAIRIIYHMLATGRPCIERIDPEWLFRCLTLLHHNVNPNVFNPTKLMLRYVSPGQAHKLVPLLLLRSCKLGEAGIVEALLPYVSDNLWEKDDIPWKGDTKSKLYSSSMLQALRHCSLERRQIVEGIWLSSHSGWSVRNMPQVRELLLRCMQLREWTLAELFLGWMKKQGTEVSVAEILALKDYEMENETLAHSLRLCDYEMLGFLKQRLYVDFASRLGLQSALDLALTVSSTTWSEYMAFVRTINIILTSMNDIPFKGHYSLEALSDITEKLMIEKWTSLKGRKSHKTDHYQSSIAAMMEDAISEKAVPTTLHTAIGDYYAKQQPRLFELRGFTSLTDRGGCQDDVGHHCHLVDNLLNSRLQLDWKETERLSRSLFSDESELRRLREEFG